jgi:hypothetical protein
LNNLTDENKDQVEDLFLIALDNYKEGDYESVGQSFSDAADILCTPKLLTF